MLEREAQSNRQVYDALLLRQKELQVLLSSRGNNVRITDRAEGPGAPVTPTLRRDLVLSVLGGVVFSFSLVLFLSYLDDTVKNPDDVIEGLNVPLLGLAPRVSGERLLVSEAVSPQFGEAFRSLRTSLFFRSTSERTRVLMVTSAHPLEGKTTTACNLALVLAIGGERVLLIDADMRRPGVSGMMRTGNQIGLSDILAQRATINEALITLESPKLSVITAGAPPKNPSELLGSPQMDALIDETRTGRYDWVVIDTPPVLAVTDPLVLTRLVGGTVFVIGSQMTRRQHAALALDTLLTGNQCQLGVVLNCVDFKRNKYYYRRYSGYRNADYYYGAAPVA
jgi:capsular exopolysaccharide synthesis family protein